MHMRVRAADFCHGDFGQIADTLNASRKGFYFRYYKGIQLRITFPYYGVYAANLEEMVRLSEFQPKAKVAVGWRSN